MQDFKKENKNEREREERQRKKKWKKILRIHESINNILKINS